MRWRLQLHAVVMAMFASIIAPFGGFFASGFKRGFKIKDFGDFIPGHGGMTDRMDCQVRMLTGEGGMSTWRVGREMLCARVCLYLYGIHGFVLPGGSVDPGFQSFRNIDSYSHT